MELILHLQPRHVYKLMRTSKAIYEQCVSKPYWERVAFHLAFRGCIFDSKIVHDLHDMALLCMGYRLAMDTFIKVAREDIRSSPTIYMNTQEARPLPDADGPLSELIPYALDLSEYILTPQEDMRLQARDFVLDAEPTSYQVQNMLDGTHHNVFVTRGRICYRRHLHHGATPNSPGLGPLPTEPGGRARTRPRRQAQTPGERGATRERHLREAGDSQLDDRRDDEARRPHPQL
jgi:hypothetical protein